MSIQELVRRDRNFRKVHESIVARMGRGFLRCGNCKSEQRLTIQLVIEYLEGGWPKCCEGTLEGGTMGYYGENERRTA